MNEDIKKNVPEDYLPLPPIFEKLERISDEYWWICKVGYRPARPTTTAKGQSLPFLYPEPAGVNPIVVSGDGLLTWKCIVRSLEGEGKFEILAINEPDLRDDPVQGCVCTSPSQVINTNTSRFNFAMGCPFDRRKVRKADLVGQIVDINVLEKVLSAGRPTPLAKRKESCQA